MWVEVTMMSVITWKVKCRGRDPQITLGAAGRGPLLASEKASWSQYILSWVLRIG
jgi:hypothetical protein